MSAISGSTTSRGSLSCFVHCDWQKSSISTNKRFKLDANENSQSNCELAYVGARFVLQVSGERRGLQQSTEYRSSETKTKNEIKYIYIYIQREREYRSINGSGVGERFVDGGGKSAKCHGHCDALFSLSQRVLYV